VIAAEDVVDLSSGGRKLAAEVRVERVDRSLDVKRCSVDVRAERSGDTAQCVEAVRRPDSVVGDDCELPGRNGR
jgi:hypothetical protein